MQDTAQKYHFEQLEAGLMSRICQRRRGKTKETAACMGKKSMMAASVPSQVRAFKPVSVTSLNYYFHLLE